MAATNLSRVLALDIRTMTLLYTFSNPLHHGTPTCFCLDLKHNWLLLGTSHGILELWDLRFLLRLKSWGIPGSSPIHRLQLHPFKGRGRWVCVAGGTNQNDVTVWDIEKMQCREVFRAPGPSGTATLTKEDLKAYEPIHIDAEAPNLMLSRFATALPPNLIADPTNASLRPVDAGIRALAIGTDAPDDGRESKYAFLLTGGSDRLLRFWDLARADASIVVSGLGVDEVQPKYVTNHPSTTLAVTTERVPSSGGGGGAAAKADPKAGGGSSSGGGGGKRGRIPRAAVMAREQQALLRNHLDVVMDVAVLERPVGMTVSVDRMGCIYIFQ
jgi:phosphoinositide-3-kinase regulatory subunit 4